MPAAIPNNEPVSLTAGDRWQWTRTLSDYPAPTWVLAYTLINAAGKISIAAAASGSDHAVDITAATTAAYTAGMYDWIATVTSGSDRRTIDNGRLEVKPNLAALSTYDARSFPRRMLEALEAVIQGRATLDQEEMSIEGRSLKRTPFEQLVIQHGRFKALVAAEESAERLRNGLAAGNRLLVRF